jgi:hypothetical protein
MTTDGTSEDGNTSTTNNPNSPEDNVLIYIAASVLAVAVLIAALVCYCMWNRCRNPGNARRLRKESWSRNLYENTPITKGVSEETLVNPPLLLHPEINREPADKPEIPEDIYLKPITVDQFWLRQREEIEKLPPAPPVYPSGLAILPVDGEGAYTIVLPDDATPLLPSSPTHEITHHPELYKLGEESGYVVPSSLLGNSVQQHVTETDFSPEPRGIRQSGKEYQIEARTVVAASRRAAERSPDMSKGTSLAEGASVSNDTWNETERPKNTPSKIYRSSFQLFLSPPTQHRSTQVSTSTPTVVVCIRTNHDNCFTSI